MERYFWTNKETAVVAKHYADGGAKACLPHLPNRTLASIYNQARKQGIMFGNNQPRPRQVWVTSVEIDRQIRDCYSSPEKGRIKAMARNISRPYWWVKRRAQALGVAAVSLSGSNKAPEWSEAEIELLEQHSHKNHVTISRIFKKHGFNRTATAIVTKRKRQGYDTVDIDNYTATQLALEFGVDPKVVTRWIDKGWLPAKRRGTDRTEVQGGDMWWISRRNVRKFIIDSAAIIDIRKVNKVWFIDLLVN